MEQEIVLNPKKNEEAMEEVTSVKEEMMMMADGHKRTMITKEVMLGDILLVINQIKMINGVLKVLNKILKVVGERTRKIPKELSLEVDGELKRKNLLVAMMTNGVIKVIARTKMKMEVADGDHVFQKFKYHFENN